jgi:predicted GH43/DUF377 family glycosyl hydrolase
VYVANRDASNRAHVGWAEISAGDGFEVTREAEEPALAPGPLGTFDDHGVFPASIVEQDGRLLLYYMGWNPGATPPLFYSSIGLASSDDGGLTFERQFVAPLLARSEVDPCLVGSPCVLLDEGKWRMWYVSGYEWTLEEGRPQSSYHVKYAESDNGVEWRREGQVCIDLQKGERNIARPWVMRDGSIYRMWYARSSGKYRIGYAESPDGLDWTRLDEEVGIEPSDSGWDSDAQAYPCVVHQEQRSLLFYNGAGYGREGFGLAAAAR